MPPNTQLIAAPPTNELWLEKGYNMPRVDIWIRVEDWEKWKKIKNKPKFIHEAINNQEG